MLKQRILTALILAAILLGTLFFFGHIAFAVVVGVFGTLAAWEWSRLAHCRRTVTRSLFTGSYVIGIGLMLWWLGFFSGKLSSDKMLLIVSVAAVWWLIAAVLVKLYPKATGYWHHPGLQSVIGALVIFPTLASVIFLRSEPIGAWLIIIMVVSVVSADTGAYFVGKRFGKNKLAPAVSPGKSMEGFYGGLVCSVSFALVLTLALGRSIDWWLFAFIVPASLVSVLGDLLESMLKRDRGIKDSGRILPGHGGVLDRIDSVCAAAPVFTLGYLLSGWYW